MLARFELCVVVIRSTNVQHVVQLLRRPLRVGKRALRSASLCRLPGKKLEIVDVDHGLCIENSLVQFDGEIVKNHLENVRLALVVSRRAQIVHFFHKLCECLPLIVRDLLRELQLLDGVVFQAIDQLNAPNVQVL